MIYRRSIFNLKISIVRIDEGIWIGPVPHYVLNYLKYHHRSLQTKNWKRVQHFEEVKLYNVQEEGVTTLAGFFNPVLKLIQKNMDVPEVHDYRTVLPEIDWNEVSKISLRDYQKEPVKEFLLKGQENSGILSCTMAWGKTFGQMITYAAWHNLQTILAIPLTQVVKQSVKKFKDKFPHKHIGQMHAEINDFSKDITITTFDSLLKCNLEQCKLLLVDEIQECTGKEFQTTLSYIKPVRVFGYTATDKGLFNNADKLLTGMFGERLIHIPYQEAEESGAVIPGIVYFINIPEDPDTQFIGDAQDKIKHGIKKYDYRNKLIGEVCYAIPEQRQTIVFVDHVKDHLINLMRYMPSTTKYVHRCSSKKELGVFALSPKQQNKVIEEFSENKFHILVATDAFRAGVDVPNCRVVVQAAGGSSEIEVLQEAGRGCRILTESDRIRLGVSPKTHFNLIDFMDNHDDMLRGMSMKRMQYYKNQGWKIHLVNSISEIDWNYGT